MLCMDPSYSLMESPEKETQTVVQTNEDQSKTEDNKTDQKSAQVSAHYWWCPAFGHLPNCQFLNLGFPDPNFWSQTMANPYSVPIIQKPNIYPQSLNSTASQRVRDNTTKKSAKDETKRVEIERLYSCRLCNQMKETRDMPFLRKHIEAHLGKVRPFICGVCGKHFNFRSNCRNHLIAHSVVRKNIHRLSAPTQTHIYNS